MVVSISLVYEQPAFNNLHNPEVALLWVNSLHSGLVLQVLEQSNNVYPFDSLITKLWSLHSYYYNLRVGVLALDSYLKI